MCNAPSKCKSAYRTVAQTARTNMLRINLNTHRSSTSFFQKTPVHGLLLVVRWTELVSCPAAVLLSSPQYFMRTNTFCFNFPEKKKHQLFILGKHKCGEMQLSVKISILFREDTSKYWGWQGSNFWVFSVK